MKYDGFSNLGIKAILKEYRRGGLSPSEVAEICIRRFEKTESKCLAWVCFEPDKLRNQAGKLEKERNPGSKMGALHGIPIGVKDIFNTLDFPTEMGSPIWKGFTPGNDARSVFNLKQAGAIIPGKTVTAEFAVHTLGKTLNPHDPSKNPGTSSSGSAVAVAVGMVPAALGTQTAGSIVRPASFCGVYGCKPSFGLIPRTGMLKTTDSLDTIGFFTHKYEDLELMFEVLRVKGKDYPISNSKLSDVKYQSPISPNKWRVALMRTYTWQYAHEYAREAFMNWMKNLGKLKEVEIVEAELPSGMERAHEIHSRIYDRALAYYFKEEFKKSELVSPIMNEIIRRGNEESIEEYQKALKEQESLCRLMDDFMAGVDVMISLSTAGEAPPRDSRELPDPALIWTMTHLPVISAPVFVSPNRLPFGIQIASRRYRDYLLFKFTDFLRSENLIPEGPNPIAKFPD